MIVPIRFWSWHIWFLFIAQVADDDDNFDDLHRWKWQGSYKLNQKVYITADDGVVIRRESSNVRTTKLGGGLKHVFLPLALADTGEMMKCD